MKTKIILTITSGIALAAFAMGGPAATTPTPPRGWNSFDSYGVYLHEEAAFANLEAFAKKLKPHGYEYFVVDGGWYGEYQLQPGTLFPKEKHASDIRYNEFGYFLPSKTYFPNGFGKLVERTHELGLKFGVHLMRGVSRKAYDAMSKGDIALAGKGTTRQGQLNKAAMRTFITMRALAASPLFMGGDLPTLDDYSLKLITDPDMLACNQNGVMGHLVHEADGLEIWRTPKQGAAAKGWIGLFNRSKKTMQVTLDANQMKLGANASLYDVWGAKTVTLGTQLELEPNDVLFLRVD